MGHVDHLDLFGLTAVTDTVGQHHPAERAAGRDRRRVQGQCLVDAVVVDPGAEVLFHPHPGATGAAAETTLGVPGHFGQRRTGGADQLPRCLIDLIVPAQVARVVVGDGARGVAVRSLHRHQLLVAHQPVEQLGVVQHGVAAADLRVLPAQGVEAVRAGGDDFAVHPLDALEQVVEGLDVLRCQLLEQEFVAGTARRVTGAGLAVAEDEELHPGGGQQFGDRLGGLLGPVVQGAGAADPEQVLEPGEAVHVLAVDRDVEIDLVDPGEPLLGVLSPRVALGFQVLVEPAEFAGELRLHHHLVAAHIHDVVDVLDVHRALLDARPAGGARPQHVRVDHAEGLGVTDQRTGGLHRRVGRHPAEAGLRDVMLVIVMGQLLAAVGARGAVLAAENVGRLGKQVVAQIHDEDLGGQRLSGVPCRALRLAAAALGAGGEVQVALPGEVVDLAASEHRILGGILEVDVFALGLHRQQRAQGVGQPLERDVERGQADVEVLGVQHDEQEDQHDADVQQQGDGLDDLVGVGAQRFEHAADGVREERRLVVGQVTGADRGTAEQRIGPDDVEDHEQDQPRPAGVRAVEARRAAVVLGLGAQPDDGEDDDAQQHGDGEEVLQEAEDSPLTDQRDVELGVEQHPVGLEVHGGQNEEAPHGEEVRDARDRPFQQPGLAEDLADLVADPLTEVVLAAPLIGGRLAGADEFGEIQDPLEGEHSDDGCHGQADDEPDESLRFHDFPLQSVGYPSVT